jgi:hypothetical protein
MNVPTTPAIPRAMIKTKHPVTHPNPSSTFLTRETGVGGVILLSLNAWILFSRFSCSEPDESSGGTSVNLSSFFFGKYRKVSFL